MFKSFGTRAPLLLCLLILASISSAFAESRVLRRPPHLDPQATGAEYYERQKHQPMTFASGRLSSILDVGVRNLNWLKHMNETRSVQLSFSSKETMTGYPIDQANKYNEEIIVQKFDELSAQLPQPMADVLLRGSAFTDNPPIEMSEYLTWGRKVDRAYQSASRWLMMEPYLMYLAQNRQNDIRGYYFLKREADLQAKLTGWSQLAGNKQEQLKGWLLNQCYNSTASDSACLRALKTAITNDQVWTFYTRYLETAESTYNSFFRIEETRRDIDWNQTRPNLLNFPFAKPDIEAVAQFLKVNIEDEWKWKGWQLVLNFDPAAATHVEFQAGVTPHVNGLAGDVIVMDANSPLTEWDVQWTIRHEFGHVLGFPDCYVEFYEPDNQWIVNYQLDLDNLMCSRKGRLQQTHFDQMKTAYFH